MFGYDTTREGVVVSERCGEVEKPLPPNSDQELALAHPATALDFAAEQGNRLRRLERRLEAFAFKRVEARLADV